MTRFSLRVLPLLVLLVPIELIYAQVPVTSVRVAIENPIDPDERDEVQGLLKSLLPSSDPKLVEVAQKEVQDLERYESIRCEVKPVLANESYMVCFLKRFPIVNSVRFEGVPLSILESELKKRIPIKSSEVIHTSEADFLERIQRTETAIRTYLEKRGYFGSRIRTLIEPVSGVPASDIIFEIIGGNFVKVRNVSLDGDLPFDAEFILRPFRQMCANVRYSFEGVSKGTKACYDKDIEDEIITKIEDELADLGYVAAHVTVTKNFVQGIAGAKGYLDLKVSVLLGQRVLTSFTFVDSQFLDISSFVQFFRTITAVEFFSRVLNNPSFGVRFPEDETILVSQLEESLTFRGSHIIDESQINASVEALRETLRARGYANASIEVTRRSERGKWLKLDFKITSGTPLPITGVRIDGVPDLAFSDVVSDRDFLVTPRSPFNPGHFTEFALNHDTEQFRSYLLDKGYLLAKVSSRIEKDDGTGVLVYQVEPGPQKHINQIKFINDDPQVTAKFISDSTICDNVTSSRESNITTVICKSSPFVEKVVEQARQQLASLYYRAGYLKAEIKASVNEIDDEVVLQFEVSPSDAEKATVAAVFIDGNILTRRNVMVREIGGGSLLQNTTLQPSELEEGLNRLRRYNVFSKLSLDYLQKDDTNEYYLYIQVAEKPTFAIDTTLAFNTERLFDIGVTMSERNLFGGLLQLKSELHFGFFIGRFSSFRNTFSWPHFFGTPMDIDIVVPSFSYEIQPFRDPPNRHARFDASTGLRWQFLGALFPTLEYQLRVDKWQLPYVETESFFVNPTAAISSFDGLSFVLQEPSTLRGILKPSLALLSLDDLFDPKSGYKLTGGLELSGTTFGAQIPFEVFNFQGTGYYTLGSFTFAANLRFKRALIQNPQDNWWVLKYQSDFDTLGGIKGPRAYDQGRIGIYGIILDNIRGQPVPLKNQPGKFEEGFHPGNFEFQSSVEIRFPLIKKLLIGDLNGVIFGDLGFVGICSDAFFCFRQFQDRQLGIAVGIGLRYVLPVGPISLDYGVSPIHQSDGVFRRESRISFQFGYPF